MASCNTRCGWIARTHSRFAHAFFGHDISGLVPPSRWTEGFALDDRDEFSTMRSELMGGEPVLAPPRPDLGAQREQMGMEPSPAANDMTKGCPGRTG
jgi:Mn-containing catalase